MLHNRFKKKLASCLCVLLAATCVLSSVPVGAIDAAAPLANDAKVNFALGCTYSGTNPYQENGKVFYPDTDHKELTDGVLGGPLQGDAEWVGYAGKPTTVEQVIDLGLEREFDTVEMVFNVTGKNAINMPTTAVVSYSGDGKNWQEFSNEKVPKEEDGVRTYASTSTAVQGRYVKVQFTYALFTWIFLSEINVLGTQSANAPEIPIIEKNLPAQKAAYTDDMVSFQVTAAVTDGGTLSYQWYKDGQPIGENSDSYTISRATLADAGTYSVTVTNDNGSASSVAGSNNCVLSVVDSGTDPDPDPEPLPNPDPNNLAEGVTYTASQRANVGYPDNGKRLTDTITASEASYRDKAWVGFNKSEASNPAAPVTIIVDLKESKNFMEVRLNTLQNMGTGIGCPSSIKLSISDDQSSWTELDQKEAPTKAGDFMDSYVYSSNFTKTGRYVKVEMAYAATWIFVDEIKILKLPQSILPSEDSNNLAFGKTYTASPEAAAGYPDANHKILTDGYKGVLEYQKNNLWAGYASNGGNTEVVIDLESTQSFQQVEMNFLANHSDGIKWPESVEVFTSMDKGTWASVASDTIAPATETAGVVYRLQHALNAPASARYVKVVFPTKHWVFVDEISILKDCTILPEVPATPESMDPNNIAVGASYTLAFPAHASYPDDGHKQLTDGKRGSPSYSAREWVGFHTGGKDDAGVDCMSAIIDLGDTKKFEQIKIGFLNDSGTGIYAPKGNVKIETSNDSSSWSLFAESGEKHFGNADGMRRYIATASASARYVKVSVYYTDFWMFMDEIEILAVKDEKEDADVVPDNGWEYNLVRDYPYQLSRNASYGSAASSMTDGKHALTATKFDPNWAGFGAGETVTMTFNLKSPASVSRINFFGRQNLSNKQVLPANLKILASLDGKKWGDLKSFGAATGTDNTTLSWVGGEDPFVSGVPGAKLAYVQYIQISFDVPAGDNYVFADEIEVIGKKGRCTLAGAVAPGKDEEGIYNLALGKTYKETTEDAPNKHPDVDGVQLTDGILGTPSLSDGAWVGYMRRQPKSGDPADNWALKSIVVDLGELKTVTSTKINILSANDWNSDYTQPWTMRVFASEDGENWMPMYKNWDLGLHIGGIMSYGWRFRDTQGVNQDLTPNKNAPYIARYIRYDIELYVIQLVDEIEVYGQDGIAADAEKLTNLSKLENGDGWRRAGKETSYTHDSILIYNGSYGTDMDAVGDKKNVGDWKPENYRPYLTYINRDGEAVDTLFDSFYFLGMGSGYGNPYYTETGTTFCSKKDWDWYIEKCLGDKSDIDALESAAATAAMELNDPNFKAKVIIMVPPAQSGAGEFGMVGDEMLNFKNPADCEKALEWYMQEMLTRFNAKEYKHLDFSGFTWYLEIGDYAGQKQYMADFCERNGLQSYWIPFNSSYGQLYYDKYNVDNMAWQPNHYFGAYDHNEENGRVATELGTKAVENIIKLAAYCGGGLELECGDGILRNEPGKYNQFLDYLNACAKLNYQGKEYFRMWYNDVRAIERYCFSTNNNVRTMYENIYQLINGTYKETPYIANIDYNPDKGAYTRPGYNSAEGYVEPVGMGSIGGNGTPINGDSGGTNSGGGSIRPEKPTEPEKPTTGKTTWEKTNGVWKLKDADGKYVTGWKKVNGNWYYMNANAVMQTGWQKIGNTWYYLKDSGAMATGWQKIGNQWYYLKSSGAMAIGWNWIGGKCYYLNANGQMAANTTIGGYKVGSDGAWIH